MFGIPVTRLSDRPWSPGVECAGMMSYGCWDRAPVWLYHCKLICCRRCCPSRISGTHSIIFIDRSPSWTSPAHSRRIQYWLNVGPASQTMAQHWVTSHCFPPVCHHTCPQENTRRWANVGLMLGRHRRLWTRFKTTMVIPLAKQFYHYPLNINFLSQMYSTCMSMK